MYRVVADGPGGRLARDVAFSPFVIGTAPGTDLTIVDAAVADHHAQLEVQPDGRIVVRDLGSGSGTLADSGRLNGRGDWLALPGMFLVGRTSIHVEVATALPAPVVSAPAVPQPHASRPSSGAASFAKPRGSGQPPDPIVPLPLPVARGLLFLIVAGVVQVLGGILLVALSGQAVAVRETLGLPTIIGLAFLNIVGGGTEIGLALAVRRRRFEAVPPLIVVAGIFAALAAWDVITLITADTTGNIALPALRLGANLGGVMALVSNRSKLT